MKLPVNPVTSEELGTRNREMSIVVIVPNRWHTVQGQLIQYTSHFNFSDSFRFNVSTTFVLWLLPSRSLDHTFPAWNRGPLVHPTKMSTLSRREEETLFKATKANALKECDQLVKAFAECAAGRTVSVAWACREKFQGVQDCIYQFTRPESMQLVRDEYLRLRNEQQEQLPS